ncbi:unnamed protein product [Macrosiphum euphorbiae]|uniref:Trimethylguanosine synthase n=1 Tax=Macrosiphum euphorbiae TaxID=13131 RepID=A0AAV0XM09_9HEMI|nr:unnamed protein product [Macrosiphum euphorbiae]
MFLAAEFLWPSSRQEQQTPPLVAAGSPMDDTPLPLYSVEEPSAARTDTTPITFKYWRKRHTLFSKFDKGILMDEESFYSVCPEILSQYMAEKCGRVKVAVDPFCGAGGNIIQLARLFDKVIAVDIDEDKTMMAKQNARIYGVLEKIEFVVADFFKLANQIKGDVIFTSPPWGGPEYNEMDVIGPLDLCVDKILEVGKTIAPKILLHLPKNLDKNECWKMCNGVGAGLRKIENVFMDRYLNSTLLYVRSNNVSLSLKA